MLVRGECDSLPISLWDVDNSNEGESCIVFLNAAILLLIGLSLIATGAGVRHLFQRAHVPPAVSLMALGLLIGPGCLDLLSDDWMRLGGHLSKVAFVVLLLRAAFSVSPRTIKRILPFALILGTFPVAAELLTVSWISTEYLFESRALGLLSGFLIAAVSPAVILPTMLNQKEAGRGQDRAVPDLIMGQTVVNALWAQTGILLLLGFILGETTVSAGILSLPQSLGGGILIGVLAGWLLRLERLRGDSRELSLVQRRVLTTILLFAGIGVYFGAHAMGLESVFAVLAMGVMICRRLKGCRSGIRADLKGLWGVAEVFLFVNLGSQIDVGHLGDPKLIGTIFVVLVLALAVRLLVAGGISVFTRLNPSERCYVTLANIPKATIQAVYGAVPLVAFRDGGFTHLEDDGGVLLMMAVLAILSTAPLGAVLLDRMGARLLPKKKEGFSCE